VNEDNLLIEGLPRPTGGSRSGAGNGDTMDEGYSGSALAPLLRSVGQGSLGIIVSCKVPA